MIFLVAAFEQSVWMEALKLQRQLNRSSVVRNERMTAIAGTILFILIVTQLIITANLHALLSVHIFVGVLLSGPIVIKMFSTGFKFVRYYTRNPIFVKSGTPNIWLRLLAPFLVLMTLLVFISGFSLAIIGPTHMGLFFTIHAASVAIWLPLVAVHIYAHIRRATRVTFSDLRQHTSFRVKGRNGRLGINLAGLIMGAIAAMVMIPVSETWDHWRISPGFPIPLTLGLFAAVFGVFIATPLLRGVNKEQQ
ncbi:hypothetical protein [Alicyclobacillus fodiniaquatilis]|uniref:Uncharacterized protein n=1 Tax=Alicyclobacillus fodiniaquatilis TaxID=1661150 RepID=A0ABW4JKR7_9BACL